MPMTHLAVRLPPLGLGDGVPGVGLTLLLLIAVAAVVWNQRRK